MVTNQQSCLESNLEEDSVTDPNNMIINLEREQPLNPHFMASKGFKQGASSNDDYATAASVHHATGGMHFRTSESIGQIHKRK